MFRKCFLCTMPALIQDMHPVRIPWTRHVSQDYPTFLKFSQHQVSITRRKSENGDPLLLVNLASSRRRIPGHLWPRHLPGWRQRDQRNLLLLRLLPRRRRWGLLLVLNDAIHRRSLPGLFFHRGGPPSRGRGRAVGTQRGCEEAGATRRRRRRGHRRLRRRGRLRGRGEVGEVIEGEQRGRRRRSGGLCLAPERGRRQPQRRGYGGREVAQERRVVAPVVRPGGAHRGGGNPRERERRERAPSGVECALPPWGMERSVT
jgi:hypothetical protein